MMRLFLWITVIMLTAVSPDLSFAHGMVHHFTQEEAVVIRAAYDDGEPMSYAAVKIYAPDNAKIEHQNGRTDKNGCFAFIPDAPGQWHLTIDGGMGHMITTDVTVDEDLALPAEPSEVSHQLPRFYGMAMGLSIIFGLTGFLAWFKSLKQSP